MTSIWTPSLLAGNDAETIASRRFVGVDTSATVKWSLGNGSMQRAPIGSQRCWVAGSTPSVDNATAGADAFGGFGDATPSVFFVDPELHPETSKTPQSAADVNRNLVDIVFPSRPCRPIERTSNPPSSPAYYTPWPTERAHDRNATPAGFLSVGRGVRTVSLKYLDDAGARWADIGDCLDNAVAESFFGSLQLELLDEHRWETRDQLANAIFEWIEAWYNPRRRHSYCGQLSPIDYETQTAA